MDVTGSSDSGTEVAFSKATRSDAGAEGVKEARSNSPGAKTLKDAEISTDTIG